MKLKDYIENKSITQDSERLFITDFMYPLVGEDGLDYIKPQYNYIDTFGRCRRIDFAIIKDDAKIAVEVDGESYHAEGAVSSEYFDQSLQRQDDMVLSGWVIIRFSYTQLQSSFWRDYVMGTIKITLEKYCHDILLEEDIEPNILQKNALNKLKNSRLNGDTKGIVVMPTGTGKTYLAALDARQAHAKKILYIAHKREILKQARNAFNNIFPDKKFGVLDGVEKSDVTTSDILFASKDTLNKDTWIKKFDENHFDYIIIDEVHHSVAKSYYSILEWFKPKFWLGLTATPDRMDQKDILSLFDYNLVASFNLNDAIENGFLVAYEYYGLTDDIDYSKIKYQGNRYNVQDLDKKLNIPKRNQAILEEYKNRIKGDKTIGFTINKQHADRLTKLFNDNGYKAVSIHSGVKDSEQKIEDFKNNKYNIAFTVDMFNEGVDIPNIRALMFLRPTESKTIFLQQLGRGLRLAPSKKSIIILDFIGNFKKANKIRQWLSKGSSRKHNSNDAFEKMDYTYNTKSKVFFDKNVEEIMDVQDRSKVDYTDDELVAEYVDVKLKLKGKRPSMDEFNKLSSISIGTYVRKYGSWIKFLKSINELSESSSIYPQGVHWGHILFILNLVKNNKEKGSLIDPKYIRINGKLSKDSEVAKKQRQTKYKVLAMMEIGLLIDERNRSDVSQLKISKFGNEFFNIFKDLIINLNLDTKENDSWIMNISADNMVQEIRKYLVNNKDAKDCMVDLLNEFPAVQQVMQIIYSELKGQHRISKSKLYETLYRSSIISDYCDFMGIDSPSEEAWKHRAPFLIGILEILGVLESDRSNIIVTDFVVARFMMKINKDDDDDVLKDRLKRTLNNKLSVEELTEFKIKYGKNFGTNKFEYESIREI